MSDQPNPAEERWTSCETCHEGQPLVTGAECIHCGGRVVESSLPPYSPTGRAEVERLEKENASLRAEIEGKRWTITKIDKTQPGASVQRIAGPEAYMQEVAPSSEVDRLRERCSRVEGLLTDVLAILPPELARRVEANMPAINPDERKV